MCGIAGFICSHEVAESVDYDKFIDGVQSMSDENLHRGGDAAGFFAQFSKEDHKYTYWWKKEGTGANLGKKVNETFEQYNSQGMVPTVFGMHTRAKSTGFTEKENANNHPVISGRVLTNHNGMVSNHITLKTLGEKLGEKDWKPGQVDSLAIPIMLRAVKDPISEHEVVGRILPKFEGGFAFHTIWIDVPGASLLVAGERYPLVVAYKDGLVAYASEERCINKCFPTMGIDLKDATIGKMDPGTFMIVFEGEVKYKGWYDLEAREYDRLFPKYSNTGGSKKYLRWLPATQEWLECDGVKLGVTTGKEKNIKYYSSIDHNLTESAPVLMYDKAKGGIVNAEAAAKELNPRYNNGNVLTSMQVPKIKDGDSLKDLADWKNTFLNIVEADRIYVMRNPEASGFGINFMVYAWFGTTEMVLNDTNSLVGVYNWEDGLERPVFATEYEVAKAAEDKQTKKEKVKYEPFKLSDAPVDEWILANSIPPSTHLKGEKIVGGDTGKAIAAVYYNQWPHNTTTKKKGDTAYEVLPSLDALANQTPATIHLADTDIYSWMPMINRKDDPLENFEEHYSTFWRIPMLWSEQCDIHDQQTKTHTNPLQCVNILANAAMASTFMQDIDTWENFYKEDLSVQYKNWSSESVKCDHLWSIKAYKSYTMWGFTFDFAYLEECYKCDTQLEITEYPLVIQQFMRLHKQVTEKEKADARIMEAYL